MYRKIHENFRLNGSSYAHDELKEVAYSLVKEGEPFEKSIGDFLLDWLDEQSTITVKTSGSTGKPKHIELQKRHMVNSARATGGFFGLEAGNSALLCLPTDYIAGKMMLVRALVLGLELDCVEPSSRPLDAVSKSYDFVAMVPLQLENSLDNLDPIKTLIVGGALVSYKVQVQVHEQVQNTAVYETYGMTETVTHIAAKTLSDVRLSEVTERSRSTVEVQTGSRAHFLENCFKTLPDIIISTDDRNCLVIEAPKITDTPVITNDMVNLISETEFELLGRYDNVINSGGVKLFPEQIEAKLEPIIPSRFFVAGLPDEKLGQKLVLIVEGETDIDGLTKKMLTLPTLGNFEIPKAIHSLASFCETETGKIRRKETLGLLKS